MKVSVIVPTYNRAHLVTETIDSILGQTFGDFELIVVDNYSTDNTENVIKSYTDERIRYFKHKNNGIIAVNRNYGMKKAQGEYIAFCDDDDLYYPEKLQKCLEIFRQHEDAVLVCHDLQGNYNGKIVMRLSCGPYMEPMYHTLLFKGNRVFTSATVARRNELLGVGAFNETPDFFGVEDWDLWMRLAGTGRFCFLNEVLGEYRIHDISYSSDIEKRLRHRLNVFEHHINQLLPGELKQRKSDIKNARADIFFGAGWKNLQNGEFSKARNWFMEGIRAHSLGLKSYLGFALALLRIRPPQRVINVVKTVIGE